MQATGHRISAAKRMYYDQSLTKIFNPLNLRLKKVIQMIKGLDVGLSGENLIDKYVLCDTQFIDLLSAAISAGQGKHLDNEFHQLMTKK